MQHIAISSDLIGRHELFRAKSGRIILTEYISWLLLKYNHSRSLNYHAHNIKLNINIIQLTYWKAKTSISHFPKIDFISFRRSIIALHEFVVKFTDKKGKSEGLNVIFVELIKFHRVLNND